MSSDVKWNSWIGLYVQVKTKWDGVERNCSDDDTLTRLGR
jgi:hypothetical protein